MFGAAVARILVGARYVVKPDVIRCRPRARAAGPRSGLGRVLAFAGCGVATVSLLSGCLGCPPRPAPGSAKGEDKEPFDRYAGVWTDDNGSRIVIGRFGEIQGALATKWNRLTIGESLPGLFTPSYLEAGPRGSACFLYLQVTDWGGGQPAKGEAQFAFRLQDDRTLLVAPTSAEPGAWTYRLRKADEPPPAAPGGR